MTLKFRLLRPEMSAPVRATDGSAGYDLCAAADRVGRGDCPITIPLGVAVEIPPGHVGLLALRSSLRQRGAVGEIGIIDSDYRGELKLLVATPPTPNRSVSIRAGERIAQLVVLPCLQSPVEIVDELTPTARGEGGLGSTGK